MLRNEINRTLQEQKKNNSRSKMLIHRLLPQCCRFVYNRSVGLSSFSLHCLSNILLYHFALVLLLNSIETQERYHSKTAEKDIEQTIHVTSGTSNTVSTSKISKGTHLEDSSPPCFITVKVSEQCFMSLSEVGPPISFEN